MLGRSIPNVTIFYPVQTSVRRHKEKTRSANLRTQCKLNDKKTGGNASKQHWPYTHSNYLGRISSQSSWDESCVLEVEDLIWLRRESDWEGETQESDMTHPKQTEESGMGNKIRSCTQNWHKANKWQWGRKERKEGSLDSEPSQTHPKSTGQQSGLSQLRHPHRKHETHNSTYSVRIKWVVYTICLAQSLALNKHVMHVSCNC